jgi:hypothetical protein
VRAAWNGRVPDFVIEGTLRTVVDTDGAVSFTVDTDGTNRTVSMIKAGSHIRVEAPGTITITEAPNA